MPAKNKDVRAKGGAVLDGEARRGQTEARNRTTAGSLRDEQGGFR